MDIRQINSAIMFSQFTDVELNSIVDSVRWARSQIQKRNIRSLAAGDTVSWTSTRNPRGESGKVTKIGRKFVTVRTAEGMLWRVPANMLSIAE